MTPPDIVATIPICLPSLGNARDGHWSRRARLMRAHRDAAALVLRPRLAGATGRLRTPPTVRLTRIAPRRLDSDNLAFAFKGVRDGIAAVLGVDDGGGGPVWIYDQRKARPVDVTGPRGYAVVIEMWWRPDASVTLA